MIRTHIFAFLLVLSAAAASAQSPVGEQPLPLGATFTVAAFSDLPTGTSIYSLLDTTMAELISDRIDAGGLTAGEPARLGARGSSWTQTTFRVGDADITDPDGSGTPLLIPGTLVWERMDVTTGLMPIDLNAPGVAVSLVPRRPSATWVRSIDLSGAPSLLMSRTTLTDPPAIARQNSSSGGNIFASGPLVPGRLGIVASAGWANSSYYERASPLLVDSSLLSAFTHLVFTPNTSDEVRLIGWAQHADHPQDNRFAFAEPLASGTDTSVHGQVAWERHPVAGVSFTLFASASRRNRSDDLTAPSPFIVERLTSGPIAQLLNPGNGTDSTWSVGAKLKPVVFTLGGREHTVTAGVTLSGGSTETTAAFSGRVGEMVNGIPARIWDYTSPALPSQRSDRVLAIFAGHTFKVLPTLTFDGGIRFETIDGSADGSNDSVSWRNWFPRGSFRWDMTDIGHISAIVGFGRYGYRLSLDDLAFGDPNAPTANVYRWNASTAASDPQLHAFGPLVARMGPGTGGNPTFSSIDPALKRPYMDEVVFGFDSRPAPSTLVRLRAIARREKELLGAEDVGAPQSSYSIVLVPDPTADKFSQQVITAYNRTPASFGADRYLLTNPPDNEATYIGVELAAQTTMKRWFLMIGGTAGRSEGLASDIGFTAVENDQGVVGGGLYMDPNARANAQGRVFTERGYTVKTTSSYQLPGDATLGISARYQDGQHFARVVTVTGLNQGVEEVRAFRNGRTRFTYTLTLDARLQKSVTISNRAVVLMLDAYNLLNTGTEIEEVTVTGATSRLTSALQPPRSLRAGIKVSF